MTCKEDCPRCTSNVRNNRCIDHIVLVFLGEPEVSDHGSPSAYEDVGQFQISVQVATLSNLNETTDDVFCQFEDFTFPQASFLLEKGREVALVAVLSDDEAVGGLPDHIVAPEHILMFEFGEGLDLTI